MLDVHPPHKPLHGTGEFFLHLFTITIGLLIAVGIEGAVTRYEHHKLAAEARETMTEEIRHNADNAKDALQEINEQRQKMDHNITQIERVQSDPKVRDASIDVSYGTTDFESTAYHTAQATGALSYMPYQEAQRFNALYASIETFEKTEAVSNEDQAQFMGLVRRYQLNKGTTSKEAADAMAERLGIWQGHLLNIHIAAMLLDEQERAFLEHREPKRHMSEQIKG